MKKYNVLDLFAGCGGLSEGFSQAGFRIVAANEILSDAAETFKLNHPEAKMIVGNIENISPKEFLDRCALKKEEIDLVIGGPPCQGFSMANRQRLIDDPRNHLYKYFVGFVKEISPKVFVMENVKGMASKQEQIKADFEDIGYDVSFRILNARDFAIPQNRERVFFIGLKKSKESKKKLEEIFSKILNKRTKKETPLKDAFWGLRKLKAKTNKNETNIENGETGFTEDRIFTEEGSAPNYIIEINNGEIPKKIYNHKARFNNDRDIEIYRRLPQGGNSSHPLIEDIMPYKRRSHIFKDKYFKLELNKVSKTITAHMKFDCNMYIHPLEPRGLTPREAARIQSFSDKFKFLGSYTKWYLQIGNAVPPLLAKKIGESIKEVIK